MRIFRLAIVGAGPYGTYAMERLVATRMSHAGRPLAIHVYERTGEFGAGQVHSPTQAPTSYLNRTAGELSFAADETVEGADPLLDAAARGTLHDWCRQRYAATGDERFAIEPGAYPRRYLHGLALRDAFDRYLAALRAMPGTSVHLHASEVVDISDVDGMLRIRTSGDGDGVLVDHVLFVTGHSYNAADRYPARRAWVEMTRATGTLYRPSPYPLPTQLPASVTGPDRVVGVAGTMLTGIDVILHLTEGRGGRFETRDGVLDYLPSGREPGRIVAFSGSGLFCFTRADSMTKTKHQGVFLTMEAVDRLRKHGLPVGERNQLDYQRHLFPLVVLEMAVLYYATALGPEWGARLAAAARPAYESFLADGASRLLPDESVPMLLAAVEQAVAARVPAEARFSWESTIQPIPAGDQVSAETYRAALLRFISSDIAAARRGIPVDPAKTAADGVWRGLRPVIVYAVNDAGLTADSHRRFLQTWLRHHNRLAYGAAPEVMEKIAAVIRQGVVEVGAGPGARLEAADGRLTVVGPTTGFRAAIDVLVDARVHHFDAAADAPPLYPNLLRRGLVRQWRNPGVDGADYTPGGLDLTDDFHPVVAGGRVDRRLTFLGPCIEGRKFFQGGAMKPHANHHAMRNIISWVNDLWAAVDAVPAPAPTAGPQPASSALRIRS